MSRSYNNKKIAVNTLYMYVRLFVTLGIGLYASRIVLLVLGVSDYGLFSVVASILGMFTFISGSLSVATSRFFNIELGSPSGDVNRCYNINRVLHFALAAGILLLAEPIGLWYIHNRLNIEPGRLTDALFIYHLSIFTVCLGIINGPCSSLFSAFERFAFLAKLDVFNTLLRLAGVIYLQYYGGDKLRLYAIIMALSTVDSFILYHWLAHKNWPSIIRWKFVRGWRHYKGVLSFSGWNLLATMATMVRSTGSDLLINAFFNTAVNGAFAISRTINNYVISFSNNFDGASAPQIIQSYSARDMARCTYLVNKLGRFCLLLFELVFFPLYIELDFILILWLKSVPPDVLVFCRLNLILAAVALTCGGYIQLINASGRIKWFKINGGFFFVICIPLGYWLFRLNAPAYSILVLFIVADIVQRIIQLFLMKRIIGFDVALYIKEAYMRPGAIAVVMSALLWFHSMLPQGSVPIRLFSIAGCFLLTATLVFCIGLKGNEQQKILNFFLRKLKLTKCF